MPSPSKLRITWVKSAIGYPRRQKATVRALGLHHLHQTVEQDDTPTTRGMLHAVRHLVSVIEGAVAAENGATAKANARPSFVVRKLPEAVPASVPDEVPAAEAAADAPAPGTPTASARHAAAKGARGKVAAETAAPAEPAPEAVAPASKPRATRGRVAKPEANAPAEEKPKAAPRRASRAKAEPETKEAAEG